MSAPTAAGLIAGYTADLLVGDPARYHPVAGFGKAALALERRTYRPRRLAGAVHTGGLVGAVTAATALTHRSLRTRPLAGAAFAAAATWAALGGRSLAREARSVAAAVDAGDLAMARTRVRALVSRDPDALDADGLIRATVESVAENTSDAVVGVLTWAAIAGPAGVVAHRAANTLDAMVGYRDGRYARFGWAAARLDDLLNAVPARFTAALAVLLAPAVGGRPHRAWRVLRRDGRVHISPNAGPVEAAFAGALDVALAGDVVTYHGRVVTRPTIGDGTTPDVRDVHRAIRLSRAVGALAAGVAAATLAWTGRP